MSKFRRFFFNLRTQLIIYYTLVSIVVLAAGSYFSYRYIMDVFEKNNEKYLLQQFSQSDYNIGKVFEEVNNLANLFMQSDDIQQFLLDNYDKHDFSTIEGYNSIISRIDNFISNYNYINSIYLYTENGGAVGASYRYSYNNWGSEKNNWFYNSQIYKAASEQFPAIIMDGGLKETDFNPNRNIRDSNIFLISMTKGVKPIIEPNRSSTLVFNIDEKYISSIYNSNFNRVNEYMYIIDRAGKIISSGDGRNIGQNSPIFSDINLSENYGSLTSMKNDLKVQIVYYRLQNTDWYLIDEIPFSALTGDINMIQKLIMAIFITSILVIFIVSLTWIKKITKPLEVLSSKMNDVSSGKLGVTLSRIPENELGALISRFNEMSLSIVRLVQKNDEMQEEKIRLEIEALQAQINPHFIYNTLNMIKWMGSMVNADNVVESVIALGNLLGPAFKNQNRMWTIHEEMDYLDNYLKIVNWRFGNSLKFRFDIPEQLMELYIPKFILQPIVENSVSHCMHYMKSLEIVVHAREDNDTLIVVVSDNGTGIEPERLKEITGSIENGGGKKPGLEENVGLYNVNRRIKLNFGEKYGINIGSVPGEYTETTIWIPKITSLPDSSRKDKD